MDTFINNFIEYSQPYCLYFLAVGLFCSIFFIFRFFIHTINSEVFDYRENPVKKKESKKVNLTKDKEGL